MPEQVTVLVPLRLIVGYDILIAPLREGIPILPATQLTH